MTGFSQMRQVEVRGSIRGLIFVKTFKISFAMMCKLMEAVDYIFGKKLRRDLVEGHLGISKAQHCG